MMSIKVKRMWTENNLNTRYVFHPYGYTNLTKDLIGNSLFNFLGGLVTYQLETQCRRMSVAIKKQVWIKRTCKYSIRFPSL